MNKNIYLDNNATTPLDPEVMQAMLPCLKNDFGNPSSAYTLGRQARASIDRARKEIASYLGVRSREIIFTSGATEAINMVIKGICQNRQPGHIISSSIEHSAVFSTLQEMERAGWSVTFLAPGLQGAISAEAIQEAITPNTALIAIMAVNNETGVKSDIETIAAIAQEFAVPLLVDGVALFGKEMFTMSPGITAMAFSGHKFHGPKGTGFLSIRGRAKIGPLISGGGQEFGLRAGTENVAGIVGVAKAVELVRRELPAATERMRYLRDYFEKGVIDSCQDVVVNGRGPRVCNTSNLAFLGVDGESLLINLDQQLLAASHGSACSTGALEPSRVLTNMGVPLMQARSSIRFSLSRFTTEEEIESAIEIVSSCVKRLKVG